MQRSRKNNPGRRRARPECGQYVVEDRAKGLSLFQRTATYRAVNPSAKGYIALRESLVDARRNIEMSQVHRGDEYEQGKAAPLSERPQATV